MHFPARPFALLATTLALVASLGVSAAGPAAAASGAGNGRAHIHRASAVHLATDLLSGSTAGSDGLRGDAYGDVSGDATMYLRELVRSQDRLSGRARQQAQASVARPDYAAAGETEATPLCSTSVPICVHYATKGPDAPQGAITPDLVLSTLTRIYGIYQSSGYRMPESDGLNGGNGDIDIYLANIGTQGYYGYCAPEPVPGSTAHHTPAFCVLDNDYSEFRRGTPLTNLEVTAAHEFFHAVQFAYDAWEDSWFMESTAVWMEDEVFTEINDNTQYLPYGPLGRPGQSLDKDTAYGVYGGWIFFRWLTEHRPALVGQLPGLVLSMWQRAAANPGSDHYSLQAVAGAMAAAGLPMRTAFAKFAAANRNARHTYQEGAANHYPIARPTGSHTLRAHSRTAGGVRIDHLAAATERFKTRVSQRHAKLHLSVDMAARKYGTDAVVTVFLRGGGTKVRMLHLSGAGRASVTVPFSSRKVKRVELTMTNASTRMHCWTNGLYSCDGTPRDQKQLEHYSASVRG